MSREGFAEKLRPWLRESHAPAFEAALEWLLPRCRTEEERCLAPVLLLLLSPLNALVVPCRPVAGSCVNFQVTLSRAGAAKPERRRLTVRAGKEPSAKAGATVPTADDREPTARIWLDAAAVADDPLGSAARVLATLLEAGRD